MSASEEQVVEVQMPMLCGLLSDTEIRLKTRAGELGHAKRGPG